MPGAINTTSCSLRERMPSPGGPPLCQRRERPSTAQRLIRWEHPHLRLVGLPGTRHASSLRRNLDVETASDAELARPPRRSMIDGVRSMAGFQWSPRTNPGRVFGPGEDGWCARDAICQLLGWPPGSDEWQRFVESPAGQDMPRLLRHLVLTDFDLEGAAEWNDLLALVERSGDLPAVAWYLMEQVGLAHMVYVPSVRWLLRYWPTPWGSQKDAAAWDGPGWPGWPLATAISSTTQSWRQLCLRSTLTARPELDPGGPMRCPSAGVSALGVSRGC
jgi:hypothetical protein